jgi:histidinol-phosphate aminotransferase
MDRRSFLKSSSLVAGGLALNSVLNHASANTSALVKPNAQHPLLLNFNENSLGMSPNAQKAVIEALPGSFRYPDDARSELIGNIGTLHNLDSKNVTLGNGSSETIQAAVAMLANKARKEGIKIQLVTPDPTFNYDLDQGLK